MTNQYTELITSLQVAVQGNAFWEAYLASLYQHTPAMFALHLAVFVKPYLHYILDGQKTVESRFSKRRTAPYGQVREGDVMLLKESGGPIIGLCQIAQVWFYHLDPESWRFIRSSFTQALCAQDPSFWADREQASFATLMRIVHVQALQPISYHKRDRRGWTVLQPTSTQLELAL